MNVLLFTGGGKIMGSVTDEAFVRAGSYKEACEKIWDYVEECKYEYGHSGYSGTFAELQTVDLVPNKVFDTQDDAYNFLIDYLEERFEKNRACCVRVGEDGYYFMGWFRE